LPIEKKEDSSIPSTESIATEHSTIRKIKAKRMDEHSLRKEKEQQRRKAILDQQQVFKDLEDARRREVLLEKLMRKSSEERKLAKEINEIKQWKQVMKENREIREKQYVERRKKDYEEKLNREQELFEKEKEERKQKKNSLMTKHKEIMEQKSRKKREKHFEICQEVTNQIIGLALKEIEYKETTEGQSPSKSEVLQWQKMFITGATSLEELESEEPLEEKEVTMVPEKASPSTIDQDSIDLAEFSEYFNLKGAWEEESKDNIIEVLSNFLTKSLESLHSRLHPLPEPKKEPILKSKYLHNIVVCGKPTSGKSTICQTLANKYKLYLINPEKILGSVLNDSNIKDQTLLDIIKRAKTSLLDGNEISFDIMTDLVMYEILKVENITTGQYQGWILEGFPNNLESAKLLEKRISGFTPTIQEFIENEHLELSNTEESDLAFSSLLFKRSDEQNEAKIMERIVPFKAFSAVIFINVEDDEVFERVASQKVDPATGQAYHMIFAPPENIEITGRLIPIDEHTRLDRAQINHQLITFNKMKRQLTNWYSRFGNIFEIEDSSMEGLVDKACQLVDSFKTENDTNVMENEQPVEGEVSEETVTTMDPPFDAAFASLFLNEWKLIEGNYVKSAKMAFRNLREFRKTFFKQFTDLKEQFINYLLQPDEKQSVISTFQNNFNTIPIELRSNQKVKQELHRRTEELKDTLWDMCDEKKKLAEKELDDHKKEPWLQTHKKIVIRQHVQLMQAELDRYIQQSKFLFDYYMERSAAAQEKVPFDPKKAPADPLLSLNAADLFVDITKDKNAKDKKKPATSASRPKSGATTVSEIMDINLDECFERAKAASEIDLLGTLNAYMVKNGLKKAAPPKTKDVPAETPSEVKDALDKEKAIYLCRIQAIKTRCNNALKEQIDTKAEHIFSTMNDWIGQRYRTDMANITLLTKTVQATVEKEIPLEEELRIDGSKFVIDENVKKTTLPVRNKAEPREMTSPTPLRSFSSTFTPQQVFSLFERLQAPSPSGFVEVNEIATTLLILVDSTFGSTELPTQWIEYDNAKVNEIIKRFDPFNKGYMNWRLFLISALFSFFKRTPKMEDLRKLLGTIQPFVTTDVNIKQDQFMDIISNWINECKLCRKEEEVAKVLFFVLKPFNNSSSSTINLRTVMLYLCMDNSIISTLTKGFEVLSFFNGTEGLTEDSIYELLNFNLDNEEEVEDMFSRSQIKAVLSELNMSKECVSLEQFCCAAIGKMLVNHCLHMKLNSVFH